ncbi:AAA-domain-containing protein [Macrolepiota fuliginosa MF-IS2]|uniref:AAA-domain-containing protein n=1 Tax=Macrolepiota fuliginosa MF-IS2 TaxID=1400762 RepID=A0A9P5XCR9_9AGAR|nr:AAA-domain-containing protein [Macrolepiota fuliginosa MF-IS2]
MPVLTRNRTKSDSVGPSGSEYNASEPSSAGHDLDGEGESEEHPTYTTSKRGRRVKQIIYEESDYGEDEIDGIAKPEAMNLFDADVKVQRRIVVDGDDEDEDPQPRRRLSRRTNGNLPDFVIEDEEDKSRDTAGYSLRARTRSANAPKKNGNLPPPKPSRSDRYNARLRRREQRDEDDQYVDHSEQSSADADGSADGDVDAMGTSDLEVTMEPEPEPEPEPDEDNDGKPYSLRQRQKINYAIPPPLEEMPRPVPKTNGNRNAAGRSALAKGRRGPGWSASGAELGRWMGMGGDDSDSDYPTRTPRKQPFGVNPFGAPVAAGGMLPGDLTAGTPSNLGRVGDAALADADPLGVNQNVTFDEVGGLDEHIHSLKEMTLLPLLYPEVFQRFGVTPPRGVLFHGPPGTGKTLLARALAASCRSNGRSISFFMRKGADCLSKWVGEAERQLRLLFEEAKNSQPSIIFFDEIDGLAPVRSSKQDQIHASIVSTLLALMDGMDGRGQVVVIGATNRPDAIDPALRRPGRFDREFYFPLPGLEAREKILSIMTKGWEGWGKDEAEGTKERLRGLAKLTKGYGGADLRALCTETALNAVQRRYPQIYKSTERLLLKPETINVQLRDFMISIKKLVPSSARSSSSSATPLPQQFVPLLGDTLEKVKSVISKVLPLEKKLSALEEAEFEDEGGEDGALDREMFSQSMQTLRVYRPRILIHGSAGMGQTYIGAAALHHLEGYHIQTLELGTLLGDSTRTVEAAIVQLFVEAKRHQPSIIYIPSLLSWCAAVSETSRSAVRAMLDTLSPTEPVLLLALIDGEFSHLPYDVKQWFGHMKENRVGISTPTTVQREEFFKPLIDDIRRPPNQFPDGVKRRKRVLEELPIAPPLEPRKPTAAELALQVENDQRTITLLKYRLGPILTELKRKFKRFTKRASDEYNYDFSEPVVQVEATPAVVATVAATVAANDQPLPQVNGIIEVVDQEQQQQVMINGHMDVDPPAPVFPPEPRLHDVDLEKMHVDLYKGRYLTPQDFLEDVIKIVRNTEIRAYEDMDRMYKAQAMFTAAQVSIQEFDPVLKLECEKMAVRERQRREEHRKNKEMERQKEREKEREEAATRRSTRSSGQALEISITDPVKLERRLKRQRGGSAGSSHGEDEENGSGQVGEHHERESKRSRMSTEEDEGRDPLDIVGQNTPSQHGKTVHFAVPAEIVEPMPMQSLQATSTFVPLVDESGQPLAVTPLTDTAEVDAMAMVVDAPRPRGGFDPTLLNPLPPSVDVFTAARTSRTASPANSQAAGTPVPPAYNYLLNPAPSNEFNFSGVSTPVVNTEGNPFLVPPPAMDHGGQRLPRTPSPHPRTPTPLRRTKTPEVTAVNNDSDAVVVTQASPPPAPVPMIVERTPTPPLPDFIIDETLIEELRGQLRDRTGSLNVEQLEQLRATCLGSVWRHRKEWERDGLVRELMDLVREFVDDVGDLELEQERS